MSSIVFKNNTHTYTHTHGHMLVLRHTHSERERDLHTPSVNDKMVGSVITLYRVKQ